MLLPQRHAVHEQPYPPDTLDLLSDPQALKEIDEAQADIANGHVLAADRGEVMPRHQFG